MPTVKQLMTESKLTHDDAKRIVLLFSDRLLNHLRNMTSLMDVEDRYIDSPQLGYFEDKWDTMCEMMLKVVPYMIQDYTDLVHEVAFGADDDEEFVMLDEDVFLKLVINHIKELLEDNVRNLTFRELKTFHKNIFDPKTWN
jgi:hypothetical protein